jgi:hypothetical protein
MHMIWHYHEGIQFNQREMIRDSLPTTLGDFAGIIQPHLSVHNVPQQAGPVPRAPRHEIRPRLGIIVFLQADGPPMVFVRVIPHHSSFVGA